MEILIENESTQWQSRVHEIHSAAFPSDGEARLVDRLRSEVTPLISLIARRSGESDGEVIGHILFSPVILDSRPRDQLMGLAPMAVDPDYQQQGIGSQLVEAGLQRARELGFPAVAVLGHPGFYPRFGFIPSEHYGIRCEYEVPAEAFMLAELESGYLQDKSGTIKYHPIFNSL